MGLLYPTPSLHISSVSATVVTWDMTSLLEVGCAEKPGGLDMHRQGSAGGGESRFWCRFTCRKQQYCWALAATIPLCVNIRLQILSESLLY